DVEAAPPHLVEARGLDLPVFALAPDDRVQADLEEDLAVEVPHLVALFGLDDLGREVLQLRGQAPVEHAGRLDEMVVGGKERVPDGPRLGISFEAVRL